MNKWIEGYLGHNISRQQRTWVKWLYLGEYCYNSTYDMTIGISPFRALYGYEPFSFVDLALADSWAHLAKDWLE